MKDQLMDLVQHTHALGFIDLIKITGEDTQTNIEAAAADRSVILQGTFAEPVTEFANNTFGMPNLAKLNTLLGLPEYKDNAVVDVTRQGEAIAGVHFENESGDFQNDYRFMGQKVIEEQLRSLKFRGCAWNVELTPNLASITRLKHMALANAEETIFDVSTSGTDLVFSFGDHSTHAGKFVFQNHIEGTLTKEWSYPVAAVLGILGLTGDATMRFSNDGVCQITINSGVGEYNYLLPAQMK